MNTRLRWAWSATFLIAMLVTVGCSSRSNNGSGSLSGNTSPVTEQTFQIVSGSENQALEPILKEFATAQGVDLRIQYKGSIDIMLELEQGKSIACDAVWPAQALWISLGDSQKVVRNEESVMQSPVVFGVKRSVAKDLGWIGKEVSLADILKAADAGKFTFAMTSATQSNSGASAYLGFLRAMAGSPEVLTSANLADPQVQEKVKRLLSKIDRSSGSSGWLKDLVVEKYDKFQAMVNYESLVIEANRELEAKGKEPMVVIYPTEGLPIADSPLGYVDHGNPAKEKVFKDLMAYLKTEAVQKQIMGLGRRAGLVGFDAKSADPAIFKTEWGIDVTKVIAPMSLPTEPVLREALNLYQAGGLRKASATVYVLDCSGSMANKGIGQLKEAMSLLLDPDKSKRFLIQPSARDIHIVVPFDAAPREVFSERGNDPAKLKAILQKVQSLQAGGGTDIYAGVVRGIEELDKMGPLEGYFPAVILMTDGQSAGSIERIRETIHRRGADIPVYSITFGEADDRQLKQISTLTGGRVFDGLKDLAKAFRDAKGYN